MNSFTGLTVRDGTPARPWEQFLDAQDSSLPFHRAGWLEVMSEHQDSSLHSLSFAEPSSGELVGVMPIFFKRFGILRVGGSPLVVEDTPYLGPVIPRERVAEALLSLRDHFAKRAHFIRVLLPYRIPELAREQLEANGFTESVKRTHVLDLSPGATALWEGMKGRSRTAVRRAQKSGVEVQWAPGTGDSVKMVEDYYALLSDVYGRQGRPTPNPKSFYLDLWRRIAPAGQLRLLLAHVDGKVIAGALFAHNDREVYYISGASDGDYRKLNATNLVLWTAMEWAAENGKASFDFVGSDIPRLARFKASFGGDLVTYSCLEWAKYRSVSALRDWYGRYGKALLEQLRRRA